VDNVSIEEESSGGVSGGKLLISEVAYPKTDASARFVELYNSGDADIDLTDYRLAFYKNTRWVELTGTIAAGDTYIFAPDATDFTNEYGFAPDLANDAHYNSSWFNGTDAVILLHKKSSGGYKRFDTYGVAKTDGTGLAWEYTDKHAVRKTSVTDDHNPYIEDEWIISTAYPSPYFDVTPGNHNETYYWDGSTNTEWDEVSNWTVNDGISTIPDAGANVLIRSAPSNSPENAKYRFLYFFNSLTLPSGTDFTLTSSNILTVIQNVSIASSANLNLKSDANGAATFIPEGTVSGDVNVQRYFPDIHDTIWHLFSPPITDLATGTLLDQYLKHWIEPSATWEYISATDVVLNSGKGYALHLSSTFGQTIDMTGTLSTADVNSPNLDFTSGAGWEGYNLVGNPYTASVDWDVISPTLASSIDNAIYYWDVANGQYIYYNNGSGTASRYIPSGQAFFIHVTADNQQFAFTEGSRVSDNSTIYYKSKEGKTYTEYKPPPREHHNRLIIGSSNAYGKTDKTFLEFHEKATTSFDSQFDAVKLNSANPVITDIWLTYRQTDYSINTLPDDMIDGRYDMNIRYGKQETYTLSFEGIETFKENQPINLFDRTSEKYYNLREYDQLNFYNSVDVMENRFEIVFSEGVGIDKTVEKNEWFIYSRDGKLNISPVTTEENLDFSYQVYTSDGRIIEEFYQKQSVIDQHFDVSSGIYLIKVISGKKQFIEKVWLSK